MDDVTLRARQLLTSQKYLSLAVVDGRGPWCANINYVIAGNEFERLAFYSSEESRHIKALSASGTVAGTIFATDGAGNVADGMQFTGSVSEVPVDALAAVHETYYVENFPDIAARREWMIPIERFAPPYEQRFFHLDLGEVWMIDLNGWELDKIDRRLPVALPFATGE